MPAPHEAVHAPKSPHWDTWHSRKTRRRQTEDGSRTERETSRKSSMTKNLLVGIHLVLTHELLSYQDNKTQYHKVQSEYPWCLSDLDQKKGGGAWCRQLLREVSMK